MGSGTKERSSEDISLLERVSEIPGRPSDDAVDAHELQRQLGLSSLYFARRLISALGGDRHDRIDRALLVSRVEALIDGSPDDKLRFAFRVHDANGDGAIDVEELTRMLWTSLAENRLAFGPEVVDELVAAMFDHADTNGDGVISYEEFAGAIAHYPGVVEHMTLGDLRWLGMGPEPTRARGRWWSARPARPTWAGTGYMVLVAVWAVANVALFVDAWLTYGAAGANVYIQTARGFGATLNLGAALVLVPMMRRTLTRLGRTRVGRVLIDEHVLFHRLVGNATLVFAVAHTAAHFANWATGGGEVGSVGGVGGIWAGLLTTAGLTGVGLLVVHVLLSVFARDAIRRSHHFELFHAVHRLWPLWFVFILLHGPVTWIWVAAPLTGYVIDKFFARRMHESRAVSLDALPARVTRVVLERPRGFEFEAGDYVFLRIPEVAELEWHPFTISSAPEDAAKLTFHVRTAGNWTGALCELAEAKAPPAAPLPTSIDGPYGTPSAHIFRSNQSVLIAAGIGVTPFASILRSMLIQLRANPDTEAVPERVHFIWVCRSQFAFGWFASLLGELEAEFPHRFDFRIFMDAGNRDIKSTVLRIAMDLLYARTRQDLITGLRSRTTLGAPRWDELMRGFAREHAPDLPHVFFCGPPGLGKKARRAAAGEGLPFRQEHF